MKNRYETLGETTVIFIKRRNGDVFNTFIDTSDLEKVDSFPGSWFVNYNKKTESYYVMGNTKNKEGKPALIGMHRYIMDAPTDRFVDHVDRNTLNNKRNNLRIVTLSENNQNTRVQKNNTSGARGVTWDKDKKKWRATVKYRGKVYYFGYHRTVEDASLAAKEGRKKLLPFAN
ncbi:hypothetical protein MKX67_18415 [Cytobacillus sp. FSL W7-1323]|uniref:hypothetical protein n=1 Tax=Cytobacillus TaxID=2675230 RepID=UPI002AFE094A|nr:hypothetical protein [Cytobacillus sp. OWB-43]MEA1855604.1 HNH endonuclease [Cytobacillus sp. OWB-43]